MSNQAKMEMFAGQFKMMGVDFHLTTFGGLAKVIGIAEGTHEQVELARFVISSLTAPKILGSEEVKAEYAKKILGLVCDLVGVDLDGSAVMKEEDFVDEMEKAVFTKLAQIISDTNLPVDFQKKTFAEVARSFVAKHSASDGESVSMLLANVLAQAFGVEAPYADLPITEEHLPEVLKKRVEHLRRVIAEINAAKSSPTGRETQSTFASKDRRPPVGGSEIASSILGADGLRFTR